MEYGQFCPVSKAAEILGERWTLLVMREILFGSRRYGDLQRGLGRISPSVLSQRLKVLCEAGVLSKVRTSRGYEYHPTESGLELVPVVEMIGTWGQRWVRSKMTKSELDVELLVLDMQRTIVIEKLPQGSVLQLEFHDQPARSRRWWLLVSGATLDLCTQHPGREPNIKIRTRTKIMAQVWMGDVDISEVLRDGTLELDAPPSLKKKPEAWLKLSLLAPVQPAA